MSVNVRAYFRLTRVRMSNQIRERGESVTISRLNKLLQHGCSVCRGSITKLSVQILIDGGKSDAHR